MAVVAVGIVVAFLTVILMNVGGFVSQVMGLLLYSISVPMMWLLDFVQVLFRKLAGLDTTYVKEYSGKLVEQKEDILLSLITSNTVRQVFIAMLIVGISLLIITSIIQIIRTEYTTEGSKNNKTAILGRALKGFAYFFITPVACVFGILLANYILKAIDQATSRGGASTISGAVFAAAAYEANRVRYPNDDKFFFNLIDWDQNFFYVAHYDYTGRTMGNEYENFLFNVASAPTTSEEAAREYVATNIDNAMTAGSLLSSLVGGTPTPTKINGADITPVETSEGGYDYMGAHFIGLPSITYFSYDTPHVVEHYYRTADINYLILWVGLAICIVTLFKATFGMIKRMYSATMLFIISPGIIGIWPLDDGAAFKSWSKKMVGAVLSAYGVIVALNLYFVIVGVLNTIYLFNPELYMSNWLLYMLVKLVNSFVRALFIIVGTLMISEFSSTVSGLIGANDGLKEGGEMASKAASAVGKGVMTAVGGAAIAGKVAGGVFKGAKGIGKGIGTFGTNVKSGGIGSAIGTSVRHMRDTVRGGINGLGSQATIRRSELRKKERKGTISGDEVKELDLLNKAGKSVTANRLKTFNAVGTTFFKNTGLGKALNTSTGGLIGAFGGDAIVKAQKGLMESNSTYKSDAGLISGVLDSYKPKDPNVEKRLKASEAFNVTNDTRGTLKDIGTALNTAAIQKLTSNLGPLITAIEDLRRDRNNSAKQTAAVNAAAAAGYTINPTDFARLTGSSDTDEELMKILGDAGKVATSGITTTDVTNIQVAINNSIAGNTGTSDADILLADKVAKVLNETGKIDKKIETIESKIEKANKNKK